MLLWESVVEEYGWMAVNGVKSFELVRAAGTRSIDPCGQVGQILGVSTPKGEPQARLGDIAGRGQVKIWGI